MGHDCSSMLWIWIEILMKGLLDLSPRLTEREVGGLIPGDTAAHSRRRSRRQGLASLSQPY